MRVTLIDDENNNILNTETSNCVVVALKDDLIVCNISMPNISETYATLMAAELNKAVYKIYKTLGYYEGETK